MNYVATGGKCSRQGNSKHKGKGQKHADMPEAKQGGQDSCH